jgi:hypothetical protein
MSKELTRKNVPMRRLERRNTMAFPRELREAIPELHTGRALELDSINGQSSNTVLFGPRVELKLVVKETGKLSGQFVIRMDLQVDAARELAATLTKLADMAAR